MFERHFKHSLFITALAKCYQKKTHS